MCQEGTAGSCRHLAILLLLFHDLGFGVQTSIANYMLFRRLFKVPSIMVFFYGAIIPVFSAVTISNHDAILRGLFFVGPLTCDPSRHTPWGFTLYGLGR